MKIYNISKIPQGLGYDDIDYDKIYESGYTAGFVSGYTDGSEACWRFSVYPPEISYPYYGGSEDVEISASAGWEVLVDDFNWEYPIMGLYGATAWTGYSASSLNEIGVSDVIGNGDKTISVSVPDLSGVPRVYLATTKSGGQFGYAASVYNRNGMLKVRTRNSIKQSEWDVILEQETFVSPFEVKSTGGTIQVYLEALEEGFDEYALGMAVTGGPWSQYNLYYSGSVSELPKVLDLYVPPYTSEFDPYWYGDDGDMYVYYWLEFKRTDEAWPTGNTRIYVHIPRTDSRLYVSHNFPEGGQYREVPSTGATYTMTISGNSNWTANTVNFDGPDALCILSQTSGAANELTTVTVTFPESPTMKRGLVEIGVSSTPEGGYVQDVNYYAFRFKQEAQEPSSAATAITINVPSAITGTGQATVTVNPQGAEANIVYTSSDPTLATVDSAGTITVLSDGTVTICAEDLITGLKDCKTVSVSTGGYSTQHLTFRIVSGGTVIWSADDPEISKTIQYRINNGEWTNITSNTGASAPSISVNAGDSVQLRGNNAKYGYDLNKYNHFMGSAKYNVEGNIMSLINSTGFATATTLTADSTFRGLFFNSNTISAQNLVLPATSLTDYCYSDMFSGSRILTTPPALPATQLADYCYRCMFWNCRNLTSSPVLPATTLAPGCYYFMFYYCEGLTVAPALPATVLAERCYEGMFQFCSSLITAPALPATTLADYCYMTMFSGCKSLTTAPDLLATNLTKYCYSSMFQGCTSLTYIKCLATVIPVFGWSTGNWVKDVSATGTFVKHPDMADWTRDDAGIPNNWTVVDAS